MYQNMLQSNLIWLDCQASNHEELFQIIGKELKNQEYVTDHYVSSLLERERRFPTGLKTKFLNIALPHTDPDVIEEPFIFVVRNNQPIMMLQMGDNSETPCKNFLFLGIKDPKSQVGLLAKMMEIFSQESVVKEFIRTTSKADMYQLLKKYL
ncbi:PTS sugar transporter subunit IIA [Streptococcus ovis]|uniref:PTS sugar transporter subunit IIA n=1 Tax=Streptococcus ovis TaxID=82806 RepID=UPI000374B7CB|nr:PTS sugar transporter subunit IIA [Streptococcus ovis]